MIKLSNACLNKLFTELSDQLPLQETEEIHQAVSIIGKNLNRKGVPIWVFNDAVAVNTEGVQVNPEDFGLVWLSKLFNGDEMLVAKETHTCTIKLPLGTQAFDIMCHFLNRSLETCLQK